MRINFKGIEIEGLDDIEIIRKVTENKCRAAGEKVRAIVDYESYSIGEDLLDAYLEYGRLSDLMPARQEKGSDQLNLQAQAAFPMVFWKYFFLFHQVLTAGPQSY